MSTFRSETKNIRLPAEVKNREMDIFRLYFSSAAVLRQGNEIGVRVRREIAFDSAESMMYNEL